MNNKGSVRIGQVAKVFVVSIVLLPADVFAWAPATHLFYAKEVIHFKTFLPHQVATLLVRYLPDFYYGCIAADITLGKKFVEWIHNCHNFDVGFKLFRYAEEPAQKAFVYGYLSHLAADTISHNYFVPYQNIVHYDTARFRHAYWEVRLDEYFGDRIWGEIEGIIKNPRNHGHDRLLDEILKDTIFSFKTNKVLFSSMMAIQRLRKWRQFVRKVNRSSSMQFEERELQEYNRLAVSAIIRLLGEERESCVYQVDPSGSRSLSESDGIRKSLRRLAKKKALSEMAYQEQCQQFRRNTLERYFSDYPIVAKGFEPDIHLKL